MISRTRIGTNTRVLRLVLSVALAAASLAVVFISPPPAAAAVVGTPCSPNEVPTSRSMDASQRCVNGVWMGSRGRINPQCLVHNPGKITYKPGECYLNGSSYRGAEFIAQGRYIANANGGAGFGISPDIEWESVINSAMRTDILQYNSQANDQTLMLDLIEAKVDQGGNSIDGAEIQADNYRSVLRGYGMNVRLKPSSYTDYFEIECKGDPNHTEKYTVWFPKAGVLWIKPDYDDCGGKQQSDEVSREEQVFVDGAISLEEVNPAMQSDPHVTTLDGLRYDFQAVGEFTVAASASLQFTMQARLCAGSQTWALLPLS